MFHGYSDALAYRRSSTASWPDHEYLLQSASNRKASLPFELEPPSAESWLSQRNTIHFDFILVAEFCELKGPKPLISIPNEVKCKLDLNAFAVRILSVDYQGAESGSCMPIEDTQTFLPDVYPSVHAYVHYMTLSDLSARGFVRPMCIAYVTQDKMKIINHFQAIREQFAMASSHLKYGSRILFKKDLEHRLQDLLYTKGCYITHSTKSPTSETAPEPSDAEVCDNQDNLLSCITLELLQSSIEQVESALVKVKLLIKEEAITDEQLNSFHAVLSNVPRKFHCYVFAQLGDYVPQHQPCLIKPSLESFDGPLRNILSLCTQHAPIAFYLLYNTFKMYSLDSLELYMKGQHTVLPHMEQMRSTQALPSSLSSVNIRFWDSIQWHCMDCNAETNLCDLSISSASSSDSSSSAFTHNACVSFSSSLEYLNSNLFAAIHHLHPNQPGNGIAKVFKSFRCGQHILYTLLMSRLLVIVGTPQSKLIVTTVVKALQPLIIPFTCPALVIPWREEGLKVTDLGWLQLVGLCQSSNNGLSSIIPDSVKHYISILDVDKRIFVGPQYSGTFLEVFHKDLKNIDDVSLLSLINSVVFDIVLKTRIYYYHQLEAESSVDNQSCNSAADADKLFFWQMSNSASDISIIKHLVEVMKMEAINKLKSRNNLVHDQGNSSATAPVVRIRHEPVSVIKL